MPVYIGIDYGLRRIGIAVSDSTGTLASAAGCHRTPEDGSAVDALAALAAEKGAAGLVVGLPLTADGREGDIAARARRFADLLRETTGLPVHLLDERFSSAEADRWLRLPGRRRRGPKGERDAVAAEIILQRWLDARRPEGEGE